MSALVWVALGGAAGALLRYGMTTWVGPAQFPWATLGINIAGSLAIGVVWGCFTHAEWFHQWGRLFLVVGLLGGFTTFSAFSLDALHLLQAGRPVASSAYVLASVAVCLLAVVAGERLGRLLVP